MGTTINYDSNTSVGTISTLKVVLSNDSSLTLKANSVIDCIKLTNTTSNVITGGINIGTTPGGAEILSTYAVDSNIFTCINGVSLLKQSFLVDTLLYISAITSWNSASLTLEFIIK
jgi:hypothetical protein